VPVRHLCAQPGSAPTPPLPPSAAPKAPTS
jgi:hypothetical protein